MSWLQCVLVLVVPLVPDQVGVLAEGLPAGGAFVGPLPCVHSLVSDEVGALAEALPAGRADVGPLPGVHSPVSE